MSPVPEGADESARGLDTDRALLSDPTSPTGSGVRAAASTVSPSGGGGGGVRGALKRAMSGIGGMMRSGRALLSSSPAAAAAAAAGSGGTVVLHQPSGRHLFGAPRAGATPQGLASSLDPAALAAAARTPRAS